MKQILLLLFLFIAFASIANTPKLKYACVNNGLRTLQILQLEERYLLSLGHAQTLSANRKELADGSISFSYNLEELKVTPKIERTGNITITTQASGDLVFSLKATRTEVGKSNQAEISTSLKCQKY